jgi:hypothetical protein
MTSEEPGVHASAIGSKPVTLAPPASLKLDLGRAFEAQAETQTQQNDRRMREMQAYTRNPGQLVGARPN